MGFNDDVGVLACSRSGALSILTIDMAAVR